VRERWRQWETGRSALQATAIQCACRDEWGKKKRLGGGELSLYTLELFEPKLYHSGDFADSGRAIIIS